MRKIVVSEIDTDFLTDQITDIMSKWSVHMIDFTYPVWLIWTYSHDIAYAFEFKVDFNDLENRIELEDLKLNIIHHIESLKDETTYIDKLISERLLK